MSVIYTFRGAEDGGYPNPRLVMDASGAIYGTAASAGSWTTQGVVFKLTPPSLGSGEWKQEVLHYFNYFRWDDNANDGANPSGGLIMDRNGALYGTTCLGGSTSGAATGHGAVFKLTPLDAGRTRWQETVLYRFQGGADGENPMSALTLDAAGALYGTTLYGGAGPCYLGCGTVFKLTPPGYGQTEWIKTTLYSFSGGADGGAPQGKLLLGGSGAVYGTTYKGGTGDCRDGLGYPIGCGVVFKLTPPAAGQTRWTPSVLRDFSGPDGAFPQGGLISDGTGALVGTASAGGPERYGAGSFGLVFRLLPPAPGQLDWTETVLHYFDVSTSGNMPIGELIQGPDGRLFGATYYGGVGLGGTIFEITP